VLSGEAVPSSLVTPVPLSVLDLAIVGADRTSGDALRETAALARRVEELGYTRFWVAEHHNMPSVASTTPPVLIAHVAAVTERIRVGSGGVMLPNHPPLVVAEQFAMLEALHPGRIDLGIGRAPGTDPRTAAALRRSADALGAEDFPRHLIDLMGLLGDVRAADGLWTRFAATPVATTAPEIVLLGSSGYSAQLAGILGLPFAFAHHFDTGGTLQAVELYRTSFEPSATLAEPYLIVTANVLAAETDDEAQRLSSSGRLMMLGIRSGRFEPLQPADAALADPRLASARAMHSNRIAGDVAAVVERLATLGEETGADELMVSTVAYAVQDRIRSFELLADRWR
jgi:luciferase family oxidoreductase group 1